jgi:hypothetical protein
MDPHIYLYNILGFVRLRWCPVVLSIHSSCHLSSSVHPSFSSRKKKMMEEEEEEEEEDEW